MSDVIINKVAESGLITLNLELFYPKEEIIEIDLKDFLFMELILKEQDFRQKLKELDKELFKNKIVAIKCTADAIIPVWAYMLITTTLLETASTVILGEKEKVIKKRLLQNIQKINVEEYRDKRVVIKGCGETPIPEEAYLEATKQLFPLVKSIMYGEPCSTVPIYKKAIK